MFVDFDSQTVRTGPYTIAAAAGGGKVRLAVGYDTPASPADPRAVQNVMAWAGGVLAGQLFGAGTSSWAADGLTQTVEVPVAAAAVPPGPADLVVTLWDSDPAGGRQVAALRLAGTAAVVPAPALVPGGVLRSLFHLYPADLAADPALAAAVRAAGVNTLMVSVFASPADPTVSTTLAGWRAKMDALVKPQYDAAAALGGFMLLGVGDDLFRTAAERDWYASASWAYDAVLETALRMAAAGVVGVEMVDEAGGTPDDHPAYREVCQWLRGANGCPPFAWPNQSPAAWEASPLADYCSRFWASTDWRNGRPDGSMTLYQMAGGIARAAAGRPPGKPWLCELAAAGNPADPAGGVRAADVVAQAWVALAHGCCGFRAYSYDLAEWRSRRAANDPAAQLGTRPGDARWPGLAAAFNSVAAREAALAAGHAYPAVVSGPWVKGRRGDLTWAANVSEGAGKAPFAGTLLTPAGESPVAAGGAVPSGGVVFAGGG